MFKSKLRVAGLIVAAGLLIAILLLILVHTPPARRYALQQLQSQLAVQDIKLDAAGISYNLVNGSATLTGVRLSSAVKADLPPFAEIGEMTVDAGILSLLRGTIHVERALLDRVALRWITTEAGRTNLPDIPEKEIKEEEGGLPEFLISSLQVDHLSLLVDDRQRQIRAELPEAQLRVTGRMPGFNHHVELTLIKAGQARIQNRSIAVDELRVSGELPGNLGGATVNQLILRSAGSSLQVSGRVEGMSDPRLDLSTRAHLDLQQIAKAAQLSEPLAGVADLEAGLKGPLDNLIVDGQLQGEEVSIREFSDLAVKAGFQWDQKTGRLNIASLSLKSPLGVVTGNGGVALINNAGGSGALLVLQNVDLERLLTNLGSPVSIASRAAGHVRLTWQGLDIETANGQLELVLAPTSLRASRNTLPLGGQLVVQLRSHDPQTSLSTAHIILPHMSVLGLDLNGQLTLSSLRDLTTHPKANLAGRIDGVVASINELMSNVEAFYGTSANSGLQQLRLGGTTAALAGSLGGTLSRPELSVHLNARSLDVADFEGIRLSADSVITPDQLRVSKAAADWKQQSVVAEGTVGLAAASPVLDLRSTVTAGDLAEILAALGQNLPIKGQGQVVATVQGTTANPKGQFSAEITGIEAYEESLGTLTVQGSLADQVVSIQEMALNKPGSGDIPAGSLTVTGSYELNSGRYQAHLASQNLRFSQLNLTGSMPLAGELNLVAEGTGTIDDPRLNFTVESSDLKVQDRDMGSVKAVGRIENRQAHIILDAPSLNLGGNARVALDAPYAAQAEIKANRLDLSKLPVTLGGKPLDGSLTAALTASGNAKTPMDGEASLRVTDASIRLSGQEIENQKPFQIDFAGRRLRISPTTLAAGASYLTLEGELPLAPPGETLAAQPGGSNPGVSVRGDLDLNQVTTVFLPSTGYSAAGRVQLDGVVSGDIPNINPMLRLSLQDGTFRAPELAEPVQQIALNVSLANGVVAVEQLSARLGPGSLDLTGTVPLGILPLTLPASIPRSEGPAELRGTISAFSFRSFSGVPEDVSGTLTASLQASAANTDLNSLTASVRLDQLSLRVAGIGLEQEVPGLLTLQDGQARVERFALVGPETRIEAGGIARLLEPQTLDLRANGRMDLSLLTFFAKDVAASGASEFQVALGGTASDVRATGFWSLAEGQLFVADPGLQLTDLGIRLDLVGNRVVVRNFKGNLNGGTLQLDGEAGFARGELESADLHLTGRGVFLEFPEGLQTASNADLRLATKGGPIELSGRIAVLEGSYTDPVNLEEELLGLVAAPSESGVVQERDPLLSRIRLNVAVSSRDPIVMDNNLAKMAGNLDLRLVGDYYRPSLLGRLALEEGGELYLRERTYYLERGLISFYNPSQIEPSLDLAAKTQVDEYEITLQISGEPGDLETSLTSEDPLPEPDIIALLVTGRKLEEARGEASTVLREQTLSLLTGTVTGRLERGLEQATGLSKVRIQPSLIAAESDPTARLTIGQDLTRQLGLIYSMDLTNGGDQIYIGEYDVTRHFTARVIHETAPEGGLDSDAKFRFEVRHDLRIGGASNLGNPAAGSQEKREVSSVKLGGGSPFPEAELLKQFDIQVGDRYDFFKVRRGLTRLNDFLQKQGYLEARVRLSREEPTPETVNLSLQVEPGPKVEFIYEGSNPGDDVKARVRGAWVAGVFDAQRGASAEEAIRNQLVEDGFLEPRITHEVKTQSGTKQVVLTTEPGTRYVNIQVAFRGVEAFPEDRLREELRSAGLLQRVATASPEVKDLLRRVYRQEGYLQAEIRDPVTEVHPETAEARILVPVLEGPRAVIAQVEFNGDSVFSDQELLSGSGLTPGQVYQPRLRDEAISRLQELYAKSGYNDAVIEANLEMTPETGQARLSFGIQENRREVVREVRIEGNDKTSDGFVRKQLAFGPGDALTPDRVTRSRRSLYNTGAYALVEIEPQEIDSPEAVTGEKSVRTVIRVQEVRPYRLQYGGFYDTDRGLGLIADFINRNTVGNAATLGLRGRYDDEFREIRAYYSQPQLAGLPFDTNIAMFLSRDIRRNANFAVDRAGFSLEQQKEFRNKFVLSYGYRFERDHSYDIGPDPFFDLTLKVGRLLLSGVRDVRDDVLDASRGSFISQSLEFAPKWVGSDLTFGRYFGQYFQYIPLSQPSEIPWSGGLRKSRLVYAGGVRLGLARAFGDQVVVPSERFFAGGGTTIRGFEQDTIGPLNVIGDPAGGEAVFIVNNELRFPLYSIFEGVGFVDVGNVYREIRDFDPFDLRSSAGFGLRIRNPYFLLRADYGLKLDRRSDESRGAFFFSIGQAF